MSTENKYLAKTESLQKELEPVCRVITETVKAEAIYLFGSRAYGTPTDDSDYDLCVIIPEKSMRPVDAVKAIRARSCRCKPCLWIYSYTVPIHSSAARKARLWSAKSAGQHPLYENFSHKS